MIRTIAAVLALAAASIALLFARPHPTPGPPMRDFEAYYAAGLALQHGADPYGTGLWTFERSLPGVAGDRSMLLPFVGPPATLPLWSALSRLPFDAANALWRALLLAALAVLAVFVLRWSGRAVTPFAFLMAAVAVLGYGPLTSALALGQIALPAFVFAALALSQPAFGMLAWAQPNVALALISQAVRRRGAIAFAAGVLIFGAACVAVAGPHGAIAYVSLLREHGNAEQFSAIQLTPAAIAFGLGAPAHAAALIGVAVALAAIAAWFVLMRAVRGAVERFCATCALLPLVMPFFHEHDLLVTFAPAAVYAIRARGRAFVPAIAGAMLCAVDWLGLAQRPDGWLQTVLLAAAGATALVLLRAEFRAAFLGAPVAIAAAAGIAAAVASAHPLPVWPDGMGPLPALHSSSAAALWHAQQAATGLFQRDAVWALLRCASLAGCVALAYAVYVSSRSPQRSKNPLPVPA